MSDEIEIQAEYTDTFGGDANYSWVTRKTFFAKGDISDLAIVRRAKALLGLSGVRCKREDLGETIALRPQGSCTIVFINSIY
tara:strand:- start:54 stop:299 length:246 start_codon:yes stop_codon:yes gene_type:complete